MSTEPPTTWERNQRILRHEVETPMDGHDANGLCCLRAQLTPAPAARACPDDPADVSGEVSER